MSIEPTEVHEPATQPDVEHAWTSEDLAALDVLISRVGEQPSGLDELAVEVELETAREELRVADEEIRVQRDQLQDLLALRQASNVQRQRITSLLPVPMVTTDGAGRIDEANAAAAARLNVPLVRLVGKPLLAFVHEADRGVVRQALSQVTSEPARLHVRLAPRRSGTVAVDLILTTELDGHRPTQVLWSILTPGDDAAGGGREADPLRLAAAVAEISRLPVDHPDPRELLAALARVTQTALPASTSVSVNLGQPAEPTQVASTSDEAAFVDGLQVRTGQGPCVDAFERHETVLVGDVHTDVRWPRLRAALVGTTVASVLAVPIVAGGRRVGAANCYSTARDAFDEQQVQVAQVLALAAGAALEAVHETARLRDVAQQLDRALESRGTIEQAKGIVMARRGCTPDEAFAHLAALSQQRNVKLRDLARALVEQTVAAAPAATRRRA